MTRRFLLTSLFSFLGCSQTVNAGENEQFKEDVWDVNRTWRRFTEHFYGCPQGATDIMLCRGNQAHTDLKAFGKWREAAKRLGDFKE